MGTIPFESLMVFSDTLTRGGWGTVQPRLPTLGEVICSHYKNEQRLLGPQNDRSRCFSALLSVEQGMGSEMWGLSVRWHRGTHGLQGTALLGCGARAGGRDAHGRSASLVSGELGPCSRSPLSWARCHPVFPLLLLRREVLGNHLHAPGAALSTLGGLARCIPIRCWCCYCPHLTEGRGHPASTASY